MAIASVGWFKRRFWGWGLAVAIISTQIAGDSINLVRGDFLRRGPGLAIAAALLLYPIRYLDSGWTSYSPSASPYVFTRAVLRMP